MGIGGNGNSPHGNPMGMGISQKMGMEMGGNGNWIDGNGREWECWKPFPHISMHEQMAAGAVCRIALPRQTISRLYGLNFDCATSSDTFNCTNIF